MICINKKIIVSVVLVLFLSLLFITPKQTHAQGAGGGLVTAASCSGILNTVSGFIGSLLSPGEVPVKEGADRTKESCLDQIAFLAANLLIERATQDTIAWINGESGEGGPRYVRDVGGFLTGIADDVVGEYVLGSSFGFVCDPFRLDLRTSLIRNRIPETRIQCSLTDVVNNISNFVDGDFRDGGWDAWRELVTRSNPYVQYLQAEAEIEAKINARQDIELAKLTWGNGFFAWEICPEEEYICFISDSVIEGLGSSDRAECEASNGSFQCALKPQVATPGSVVENQLNNILDSGQRRLQVADELNEIISSILNKLINDVFSPKGLAGLKDTQNERGRSGSTTSTASSLCRDFDVCTPLTSCLNRCTNNPNSTTIESCAAQCEIDFPPDGGPSDSGGSGVCRNDGTGTPDYEGEVQDAIDTVIANNPTLAQSSNVEGGPFRFQFIAELAAEIDSRAGFNGTDQVLNGNDNPTTGDLIAIWGDGDVFMERYDVLAGSTDPTETIEENTRVGYTGDIVLDCVVGGDPGSQTDPDDPDNPEGLPDNTP